MIVSQTLFSTILLSSGYKIVVTPQKRGTHITVEKDGYSNSFVLSEEGIGEFIGVLQRQIPNKDKL